VLGIKSKETDIQVARSAPAGVTSEASSFVGSGMKVTGNCVVTGKLKIAGNVAGNVEAEGLELQESGSIDGDVSAPKAGRSEAVFVIAGRVEGTVRAPRVEVRRTGRVLGGIIADHATIHGKVEGGLEISSRLAIEDTAVVEGDVQAGRLTMKEGGHVNGTIVMGEASKRKKAADPPMREIAVVSA